MERSCLVLVNMVLLAGCVTHLDDESDAIGVGRVERDCVVPPPATVSNVTAPAAVEWPGESLWIWDELTVGEGDGARTVGSAAALVRDAAAACDGGVTLLRGAEGAPLSLLALDPEEQQENLSRTDGKRVALRAVGGFASAGAGVIYYDKLLRGPGFFDAEVIGTGVCTQSAPDAPCLRTRPGRYADEPTLLWLRPGPSWGSGAFVDADGLAYLYGCQRLAAFEHGCSVARVRPAEAADPEAYRYYEALGDSWQEVPAAASVVAEGSDLLTGGYDEYLGRYALVGLRLLEERVEVRVADQPQGAFARPMRLFDAVRPEEWFVAGGREHAALRGEAGRRVAISYHVGAAGPASGLHLVTFRFDEDYRR